MLQRSLKAKKGKAGIERACSAKASPGQIKVPKKDLTAEQRCGERIGRKWKKDEGTLTLLGQRKETVRRTTCCPEQSVHTAVGVLPGGAM